MAKIGDLQDLQEVLRRVRPERTFITSYCASLSYLESGLLDSLRTRGRPRVRVLVDAMPFADCQAEVGIRYPGVRYEPFAVAVHGGYRFHPKTFALLGESRATLIVASANLTVPGFRSNWEVFELLEVERSVDGRVVGDTVAIAAYAGFLERLAAGAVTLAPEGRRAAAETADELRELLGTGGQDDTHPSDGPFFIHSLDEPILAQLLRVVPAAQVGRITAFSPYYDGGAEAVRQLLHAFPAAKRVDVVLDPSSEESFNGAALTSQAKRLRVYRAASPESAARRFLHAKLLAFETADATWLVSGSANLTTAGLCGAAAPAVGDPTGNVEAVVVRRVADPAALKHLLSVVPRSSWTDWPRATFTLDPNEGLPDDGVVTVFDAELDDGIIRCVLGAHGYSAGSLRVTLTVEDHDRRLTLDPRVVHTEPDVVQIEAPCADPVLLASDRPARVIVHLATGRGATARVRSGCGWLRRPKELALSASSVSMRERLRPLRQTATPSAETLIELHHSLATALARLGRNEDAAWRTPPNDGAARSPTPPRSSGREAGTIDVSDLLQDDAPHAGRRAEANERPHDYLRAISDTLRAHLSTPEIRGARGPQRNDTATYGQGGAGRPGHSPGDGRVDRRGPADASHPPRRTRPPATLSHATASELAHLSSTFATAVRSAPLTAEGIGTLVDVAETVGLVVLAADVVRSPADEGAIGPRAALAEALASWWASILSIAPGPDGSPKGALVRAWAAPTTRALLEDALAASEASGAGGLAGLTSGVLGACAVLRHEGVHAQVFDEVLHGLALLSGDRQPIGSRHSATAARARVAQATAWWPLSVRAGIEDICSEGPPAAPTILLSFRRWRALEAGVALPGEEALAASALRCLRRLRPRYNDAIATFDPQSRRTSCCPTLPTHTGFAGEVARAWPSVAECPSCGRLVAPPEVHDALLRAVVEWFIGEGDRTAISAAADPVKDPSAPLPGGVTTPSMELVQLTSDRAGTG